MNDGGELADQYATVFNERDAPITGDDLRRAAEHIAVGGQRGDLGPSLIVTVERIVGVVERLSRRLAALEQRVDALEADRAEVVGE